MMPTAAVPATDAGLAHLVPSAFTFAFCRQLGQPRGLFDATPFADSDAPLPELIALRDFLTIVSNIVGAGNRDAYVAAAIAATTQIHLTAVALPPRSAPTLRDALAMLALYGGNRAGIHRYVVRRSGGRTFVELGSRVALAHLQPVLAEIVLTALVHAVLSLHGDDSAGLTVALRRDAAAYSPDMLARMACAVEFSRGHDGITLPTRWESIRSNHHDPALWTIGVQRCASEAEQSRTAGRIRLLRADIEHQLSATATVPRLAEAAARAGCSARTLMRQLRAAGLTYQQLVDAVRRDRARELLASGCPVGATAEALGFADPSSFRRCFRRWYGTNPGAFERHAANI